MQVLQVNKPTILLYRYTIVPSYHIQGYNSWKLYFTSDSDFFVREVRGSMRFRIDKNNKVKGLSFNGAFAKKIE